MFFGLSGASSTFQRLMQNIFVNELDEFVVVYVADVLIFLEDAGRPRRHLEIVPRVFVEHAKCEFATQWVQYFLVW